ncbi:hypothetical protein [Variovorax sp. DT-64]|uniref:hypothetical protein n=1 Tax=Variovorax sp. DT-64 TaxID=3396160 RepID=UPI003F19A601
MTDISRPLKRLLGRKIEKIDHAVDYLNAKFAGGGDLTIYNSVTIIQPKDANFEVIENCRIIKIVEDPQSVEFHFDNGSILGVSLIFDPSVGVESMQLVMPGEPIVVWN